MELNINYHFFKQSQYENIQCVTISPSPHVFQAETTKIGEPNYHNLYIKTSDDPDKVTHKVFQKLSPTCRFIIGIDLNNLHIHDASVLMIKKCAFQFITIASFQNNHLTQVGAKYIYQCNWKYLVKLNLGNNPIKSQGLSYLCKGDFSFLDMLNLKSTKITDDGIRCLMKARWPKLSILILSGNTLTNSSFKAIITCNFPRITGAYLESYTEESDTFFNHNLVAKAESGETSYIAKYSYMPRSFFKVIRHKTSYQFLQPFDDLTSSDEEI